MKMKGCFKTQGIQALVRTENFKGSSFCFVFFFLNVVQKLVFPFRCFCAVTSASVHLPGKWEGQGLELWQQQCCLGQGSLGLA